MKNMKNETVEWAKALARVALGIRSPTRELLGLGKPERDQKIDALRARVAVWISPVTEEERLETATQLVEASARASYLAGVLESIQAEASALRAARVEAARVASDAMAEARRLRDMIEILEAGRDRVGESLRRTGIS